MQVVSGPTGREHVHFEAPVADRLPVEYARLPRLVQCSDGGDQVISPPWPTSGSYDPPV